jgi:predicted oxidoreductase
MGLLTARIGHVVSSSAPIRLAGYAALAGAGVIAAEYAWGEDFGTRQSTPSWHNHVVAGVGAATGLAMWMNSSAAAKPAVIIAGGAALGAYLVAPMLRRALAEQ